MRVQKSSTIYQKPLNAVVVNATPVSLGGGGGGGSNLADKLRELQTARDEEVLTESEFQAARQNAIASLAGVSSAAEGIEATIVSQQPTTRLSTPRFGAPTRPSDHPAWRCSVIATPPSGDPTASLAGVSSAAEGIEATIVSQQPTTRLSAPAPAPGDGLAALIHRNQNPQSGVVQFRIGDTYCRDHLDDNNYWLEKDGLSRDALPAPLQGRCTLEQWRTLLNEVAGATYSTRCSLGLWCLLGGMVCSPLATTYCKVQTDRLLCKVIRARDRFEKATGLTVFMGSFMSHFELEVPEGESPHPHFLRHDQREKDRGVLFFQVIVPPQRVPEEVVGGRMSPHSVEGCWVGMCVIPPSVTAFYAYPFSETDVITSGFTNLFALCLPWRRQLTNKDTANNRVSNQLRMIAHKPHERQVWTFCCCNNILWGSPVGMCAIRILPGCGLGALRKKN
jgi:hypothetical protein